MLSHAVQNVLAKAVHEMRVRKHEFLTSEHILLALTYDNDTRTILEGCGANIKEVRTGIEKFFLQNLETSEEMPDGEIMQTPAVERILTRAFEQVNNSGRLSIEVSDMLSAMFLEEESWALHILQKQGLSRIDVIEFISHRMPQQSEAVETEDPSFAAKGSVLEQFCTNLNAKAKNNEIDPLIGRESEVLRIIEVLARRRKNNPLIIGDSGIGKTAIIEGLAIRIEQGKVPKEFRDATLYSLDIASLMAGAKYRGEFEGRFKAILTELETRDNVILVVDEIHSLISSSNSSHGGGLDAGNMLKPFLSHGKARCIGTTTHEEYRATFSKDRALARRFQKIDVVEPSQDECVHILKGLQARYEEHHSVRYGKNVIQAIVDLSARYIQDRMLPDKAIDVLDESAASLRMKPSFRANNVVHIKDVERVIARIANIPTASVSADEKDMLKDLASDLKRRIFGQDTAVDQVTKAILRSRANLSASLRPTGSFLFYGPTGVGKTELAKALSDQLSMNFIRFDMSEYMEKHAVARLIGAPPGYVGFEQGGLLTEAVRKTPHSVILFDEIEKAHPDIYNILLQVMDYATLTDNNGKKTDFRNCLIIMTTNAGASELSSQSMGFSVKSAVDTTHKSKKAVEQTFTPEFRNRLDALIPFSELNFENILSIVDKTVNSLFRGLQEKKIKLVLTEEAKTWLAKNGFDSKMGARPLERLIRTELEDYLAEQVLFGNLTKGGTVKVTVDSEDAEHLTIK